MQIAKISADKNKFNKFKIRKLCRKKSLRFLLYSVYKIRQKYQKMPSCAVKGCESSSEDSSGGHSIIFYSIPEDLALRKQWANFCCNSASQDLTICSLHFEPCELENSESKYDYVIFLRYT